MGPKNASKIHPKNVKPVEMEKLNNGMAILHCWIRAFEFILHLSYRLEFKSWRVSRDKDKISYREKKKNIQDLYHSTKGLLIDRPKQDGSGNTNDGNTARRFFDDIAFASEVTGVDFNLIKKLSILVRALNSGKKINTLVCEKISSDFYDIYSLKYSWFYLPPTIHKIICHGIQLINNFDLLILIHRRCRKIFLIRFLFVVR